MEAKKRWYLLAFLLLLIGIGGVFIGVVWENFVKKQIENVILDGLFIEGEDEKEKFAFSDETK